MMIGTLQDYISAKERVPQTFRQKCWREFLKFFDIEYESEFFQAIYVMVLGFAIIVAFATTYKIFH